MNTRMSLDFERVRKTMFAARAEIDKKLAALDEIQQYLGLVDGSFKARKRTVSAEGEAQRLKGYRAWQRRKKSAGGRIMEWTPAIDQAVANGATKPKDVWVKVKATLRLPESKRKAFRQAYDRYKAKAKGN